MASRLLHHFNASSPDCEVDSLSCRLAVFPANGGDPWAIGDGHLRELQNTSLQIASDTGPMVYSSLQIRHHRHFNCFVDVKIVFRDYGDDGKPINTSVIVIRLDRDSIVAENGQPARLGFREVSDNNLADSAVAFGLTTQALMSQKEAVAKSGERLFFISIPYAASPPSANLNTRAPCHGSQRASIEHLRRTFASNGVIHALVRRPNAPIPLMAKINARITHYRNQNPLDPYYAMVPRKERHIQLGVQTPKDQRPKVHLAPQVIFCDWDAYMTVLGYGVVQEREWEVEHAAERGTSMNAANHAVLRLDALRELSTGNANDWARKTLLGTRIIDMPLSDMYNDVERDELGNQAMWLSMSHLNPGQAAAMAMTQALPNGIGLIQGQAGTGKSFLLANMVLPLLFTDARVGKYGRRDGPAALLLSTANESVDEIARRVESICEDTCEQLSVQGPMYVVRVHSAASESALLRRAVDQSHDLQGQQHTPGPTELDLSDFARSRATMLTSATDAAPSGIADRRVKLVNLSLGTLMMLLSGFETTCLAERGQQRFARFREFYQLYEDGKLVDEEAKKTFFNLQEELRQAALRHADVVVTTLSTAASRKIRGVVQPMTIIVDDAARTMEPDIWSLFTWYPRGVKLFLGDTQQLRPFVMSEGGFSDQLRLSFFARFLLLGYPCVELVEHHRSVGTIKSICSKLSNAGHLETSKQTEFELRSLSKAFEAAVRAGYNTKYNRSALLFDIKYSEDACIPRSKSYINIHHVRVALDAVEKLLRQGINAERIAVLVPYLSQLAVYRFARNTLAQSNPSFASLHMESFDTIQSREYDFTIVDLVRTSGPGFLRDSRRVNVALSRARYGMIILANRSEIKRNRIEFRDTPPAKIREIFASMKMSVIEFQAHAEEGLVEIPGLRDITAESAAGLDAAEEPVAE
ncbi:P-loop containing nucleoside triphosphate hydrolase protein [Phyllosticta citribraziliensis]|uniref:P-loop containing nucleoside triphosphate hydrolase protein n=1 Tax=Phyllosticta citribraziliensis TaxID=989973 RepID=A0ABR1LU61_9PEZI